MTPKHLILRITAISSVLAALIAGLLLLFPGQFLLLRNASSGAVLLRVRAEEDTVFSVSFVHSVNKSPVSEHYRILDSSIFLESISYSAFGAGMPTEPDPGQILEYIEGDMVISGYNKIIPDLVYSIGRSANHTLHISGYDIPLSTLDDLGQPVRFSIINYPLILAAFGSL